MPGRTYVGANRYRYNFNGKESDPEAVGTAGGIQDYGMRIYNPSLGKFLSVDPLTKDYPELTPYQFASNMPINSIDLDGEESKIVIWKIENGKATIISTTSWWSVFKKTAGYRGHGTINVFYDAKTGKQVGMVYQPEKPWDWWTRKGEEEYRESQRDRKGGEHINVPGVSEPQDNILDWGNGVPDVGNDDKKSPDAKEKKKTEEKPDAPIDVIVYDKDGDSATHYYQVGDELFEQRIGHGTAKARTENNSETAIPVSTEVPKLKPKK